MVELKVGDPAPDFELEDQTGKQIKLSQYAGKNNVLLVFFPFAFSPVCTNELGELKEKEKNIEKLNAKILAVSVDSSWAMKAFAKQLKAKFPMLSDYGKKVAPLYGALYEDKGFAKRSVFVVDRQDKIAYTRFYEPGTQPNLDEAIEVLKKLA